MKKLMCGLALSIGLAASAVNAQVTVNIDGIEFTAATLMANCTSMSGAPEAQLACFNALSDLLKKQKGEGQDGATSIPEALEALRTVAQFQNDGSGLSINGADCKIQIVYFNNYYHLSRRNVSALDVFSAQFDASKLQYDQIAEVQGAQAPLLKGLMEDGVTATMHGGLELKSTEHKFDAKSSRTTMEAYSNEIITQLPARENQTFDFVLVHPERSEAKADIMTAFEAYVTACKQ